LQGEVIVGQRALLVALIEVGEPARVQHRGVIGIQLQRLVQDRERAVIVALL
jgi:hypothetical protein